MLPTGPEILLAQWLCACQMVSEASCVTLSPSIRKELGSLGSHKCDRHLSAGQCLSVSTGNLGILLQGTNTGTEEKN